MKTDITIAQKPALPWHYPIHIDLTLKRNLPICRFNATVSGVVTHMYAESQQAQMGTLNILYFLSPWTPTCFFPFSSNVIPRSHRKIIKRKLKVWRGKKIFFLPEKTTYRNIWPSQKWKQNLEVIILLSTDPPENNLPKQAKVMWSIESIFGWPK